jgi:hypothetical protein
VRVLERSLGYSFAAVFLVWLSMSVEILTAWHKRLDAQAVGPYDWYRK